MLYLEALAPLQAGMWWKNVLNGLKQNQIKKDDYIMSILKKPIQLYLQAKRVVEKQDAF